MGMSMNAIDMAHTVSAVIFAATNMKAIMVMVGTAFAGMATEGIASQSSPSTVRQWWLRNPPRLIDSWHVNPINIGALLACIRRFSSLMKNTKVREH